MKKGHLYICLFLLLVFGMLVSSWHIQTSEPKAQNSISIDIEAPHDQKVHPDGIKILVHSKELSDTETVKKFCSLSNWKISIRSEAENGCREKHLFISFRCQIKPAEKIRLTFISL